MQKTIITCLLGLFFYVAYGSEKPSSVPSKLLEIKSKAWYVEKMKAWKSFITEQESTKEDWLAYFNASLFAGVGDNELSVIADGISQKHEGSFESFFAQAKLKGWTKEGTTLMEKAMALSERQKFLPEKILLAEIAQNKSLRQENSKALFNSQKVSSSLLNYSYNVLMSIGENGVLILRSEHTTIPIWLLQDVMDVRRDVKVLNLDLAENPEYLSNWLKVNQLDADSDDEADFQKTILQLPKSNPHQEFYYALTYPQSKLHAIEQSLYVVGLASVHSPNSRSHNEALQANIENKFMLDYLTVDFNGESKTASGRVFETNYILPFMLLKDFYEEKGDVESTEKWRQKVLEIAERSQLKSRVLQLMGPAKENFKFVELDIKAIDGKQKLVKGNLYAAETELTNADYWFYLDFLRKNGHTDLFEKSKADLSKYDEFTATLLSNYHYSPANLKSAKESKRKIETYMQYPALDMSFEAAKGYCEWLTYQYNQQPNRKHKKVKFRLPSQKEWTMAALGYADFTSWELKENIVMAFDDTRKRSKKDLNEYNLEDYNVLYPWWRHDFNYRDKIKNQHDCYLANIKVPHEVVCPAGIKGDGFTLTAPVAVYFPNGIGLYDVVGNAAEMIDEEGKAMGGSWNHLPEESTITSINLYKGSDASVGLRVFMEVIEK